MDYPVKLSNLTKILAQPQSLIKWKISVEGAPKWGGNGYNPDMLALVTVSSLPQPQEENIVVNLGGFDISYTGRIKRNGTITLTFHDNTAAFVTEFIHNWMAARWSTDASGSGNASEDDATLKVDFKLQMLGQDGKTPTQTYVLIGCLGYLSDVGGQLGQQPDSLKPVLQLTYDDFIWRKGA